MYCTLKTNGKKKNNLMGNDSNKYHWRESCTRWWVSLGPLLKPWRGWISVVSSEGWPAQTAALISRRIPVHNCLRVEICFRGIVSLAACPAAFTILFPLFSAKITSRGARRRLRRTAASPWRWRPPRRRVLGHNIRCCSGENSHHTWGKKRERERIRH